MAEPPVSIRMDRFRLELEPGGGKVLWGKPGYDQGSPGGWPEVKGRLEFLSAKWMAAT